MCVFHLSLKTSPVKFHLKPITAEIGLMNLDSKRAREENSLGINPTH